jgi:hypothetical protein
VANAFHVKREKETAMTGRHRGGFARHWREIAWNFLKLGVTAYGGPAIMGLMQAELQDKQHDPGIKLFGSMRAELLLIGGAARNRGGTA